MLNEKVTLVIANHFRTNNRRKILSILAIYAKLYNQNHHREPYLQMATNNVVTSFVLRHFYSICACKKFFFGSSLADTYNIRF